MYIMEILNYQRDESSDRFYALKPGKVVGGISTYMDGITYKYFTVYFK